MLAQSGRIPFRSEVCEIRNSNSAGREPWRPKSFSNPSSSIPRPFPERSSPMPSSPTSPNSSFRSSKGGGKGKGGKGGGKSQSGETGKWRGNNSGKTPFDVSEAEKRRGRSVSVSRYSDYDPGVCLSCQNEKC